jgi:hypothetical protein
MARIALFAILLFVWSAAPAGAANGWWTFDRDTNVDSTLHWKWTYPPSPAQYSRSWRAGSGTTTDECQVGRGWLPAGWYAQNGHWDHYDGSKIKGRVWWMQDKYCRDGVTRRTELFIHSEETSANGQACTATYDDPFCWERESDYYSLGCIKLARPSPVAGFPNNLGSAHGAYHDFGGSDVHGQVRPADTNELYVFS